MQGKYWIGTLNNPEITSEQLWETAAINGAIWMIGQTETG